MGERLQRDKNFLYQLHARFYPDLRPCHLVLHFIERDTVIILRVLFPESIADGKTAAKIVLIKIIVVSFSVKPQHA